VLDGDAFAAEQAVRLFLRVGVVVQADEAEIGQGAETGLAQIRGELVVAGGGDLAGPARPGRGDPDQVSLLVGEREKQQAMGLVLAGVILPVLCPGVAAGADPGAVRSSSNASESTLRSIRRASGRTSFGATRHLNK
jgi:hypothetical protein